MQSDPSYARAKVAERDRGICAQCGIDTTLIRKQLAAFRGFMHWARTEGRIENHFGMTARQISQAERWDSWRREVEYQAKVAERIGTTITYTPPEPDLGEIDPAEADDLARFIARLDKMVRATQSVFRRNLAQMGFDTSRKTFWDMDHVIEVVRGGSYKMENLQTLCQPCHKRKTARLAAERAMERSGQPIIPGLE